MAQPKRPTRRVRAAVTEFLGTEVASGAVLVAATLTALVLANGPLQSHYHDVLSTTIGGRPFGLHLQRDIGAWIGDLLIALFFFVVGLEIKRELTVGELRDRHVVAVPAVAAFGGMLVPALLFAAINAGTPGGRGWGIPMATDLPFALGVLALLGPRVRPATKLFLLTFAIIDDIGAIVVIAVFYGSDLAPGWGAASIAVVALIVAIRKSGVERPIAFALPALAFWVCVSESGIHPTVAGVALGLLVPAHGRDGNSIIERLEHRLHPWSAFVAIPLFALANAGIEFNRDVVDRALTSRVTWGIVIARVVGKTVGITAAAWLGERVSGARSRGVPLGRIGVATLGGIGFTVSLLVAEIAFAGTPLFDEARVGILAGSIVSAMLGFAVLVGADPRRAVRER